MHNNVTQAGRRKSSGRIATWVLALCMGLGLFGFSQEAHTAGAPNVEPQIIQRAAQQPGSMLRVIVQKMSAGDNSKTLPGRSVVKSLLTYT